MDTLVNLLKPYLVRLLNNIDEGNQWQTVLEVVLCITLPLASGVLLTWWLQKKKLKKEIAKIDLENKEKKLLF